MMFIKQRILGLFFDAEFESEAGFVKFATELSIF
jgi:hypothetical protein